MGEVYEALQEPLSRRVALKTILPEYAEREAAFARFRREAESSAALGHPNIVQVTDFQSLPGEPPLLVMELLDGVTLRQEIERSGKLDPTRAAFIAMQILSGLEAAHRAGIVHRDVKPANVFLLSTLAVRDLVKVLDFGVAKLVEDATSSPEDKLTAFGQVLGTLSYMAPEQASGVGTVDHRADIYAVGATLYHMLTGLTPLGARVLGAPPPSAAQSAPWVDPRLSAIVDRALERDPAARWASAEEMAAALAPFAEGARASGAPPLPGGAGAGYDTQAAARMSAPTAGGATDLSGYGTHRDASAMMSQGPGPYAPTALAPGLAAPTVTGYSAPSASGPSYPMHMHATAMVDTSGLPKWIIPVVIGCTVVIALTIVVPYAMAIRATRPSNIELTVEKGFLQNAQLKPCRFPARCTATLEDHDVTFPVCSGHASRAGALAPGDAALVKRDGDARIVMITEAPSPNLYRGVWVTKSGNATTFAPPQVLGQVCKPGAASVEPPPGLDD